MAAGSVSVTRQGAVTVVTQSTDKGAIDWRSFSVGPQETVRFDQPGRSSITLNRVTGSEISRIDGSILSNGQVWLSNPNGVLIGPSGQVNVGSLLATTGRIDAAEFMRSGRAQIDQIGKDAAIVNGGTINVAAGGYAALAAASIRNEGVVAARAGTVAMGAGKAVTVDFVGDKLLQFQVSQPLDQAPSGVDSAGSDAAIVSSGTIAAQGGTVLLSARAAKGVMDNVVNLKGHVIANSVTVDGGTVHLGDGGTVQVSARIDASSATDKGGAVAVLGEKVGLMDGAVIDASGATGGGTVLIGGDWQGKGELGATGRNAQVAYVAPTASINVDATQRGDGGTAVAWADDTTRFNGSISAQGGLLGGDGGKVETSGKRALAVGPIASVTTNARAAQAKAGAWLLDPNNIAIAVGGETNITGAQTFTAATDAASTINASTIQSALATGNVVVQTTTSNSSGAGDISWASGAAVSYAGANSLTLQADRDITMAGTISFTGSGAVTLNSRYANGTTGGVTVSGTLITTGGAIVLAGGAGAAGAAIGGGGQNIGVLVSGLVNSGGGAVTVNGQGAASGFSGVSVTGTLNSAGGAISITGAGGTNGAPGLQVVGGTINSAAGNITITGTGGSGANSGSSGLLVSSSGLITTTDGAITASAIGSTGGTSNSTDGVNLSGGTISATGTGSITLTGVRGGGGPGNNFQLTSSALISTNSGNLTINGTATSGGGAAIQNSGVLIHNNSAIKTVNGAITVNASAAPTASSSGILLGSGTNGTIAATGAGTVTINTQVGGSGGYGMYLSTGTIAIGSGSATLNLDNYGIFSGAINSTGGVINMRPSSAATSIGLAAGAGTIAFDQLINTVTGTPSSVVVGRSDMTALLTVGASGYVLPQNVTLQTGSGGIVLLGPINSNTAGNRSLKLQTATGTVSYGATIGMTTALAALDISAALTTTLGAGNPVFGTTGSQSYAGAFRFVGNGANTAATFSTTGGDIIFANTIDSSATGAEQGLLFAAGTGKVSLAGAIGNTTSMRSINSSGSGSVTVNGLLRSSSTQSYAGAVIVESNSIIRATSSNVIFAGAVNGPGDLTVDTVSGAATAAFAGQVGSTTALGSFTRTGGTSAATYFTNAVNTIKTTGTQSYSGPVIFANSAVALSTTNSAVTFSAAVDSLDNGANIGGLTIAAGTGAVSFGNNVGVGTALANLSSTGSGAVRLGGTYRTTGTQSYAGSLS
ncbi:MAG: beta strand repeat-containing protein, partial [Elsteraceae bacterium]